MAEEKQIKKKRTPELKKKRRKKALFGGLSILSFIFAVIVVIIFFFGAKLIENVIIKTVEIQSKGLYEVKIGKIETEILKIGFTVEDFHLIPNKTIYQERKKRGEVQAGLYDIKVPKFSVGGLSLSLAFYQNIFIINSMDIHEPVLQLIDIPIFTNTEKYEEGYDDIRPVIVRLVEFFKVENLKIHEGVFDIFLEKEGETKSFTASKISLNLKNFQIDKKGMQNDGKFLYSEGGEVLFKDYKLNLNDGIHIIEANEIGINSLDSLIYAIGFSLNPKQMSLSDLRDSESSYINAFFPEISLKGTDIVQAYERDTFIIKEVKILRPKIKFSNQKPLDKRTHSDKTLKNQFDFYPLIKGYFDLVAVNSFLIEQGRFQYNEPKESVPENINIRGIDVKLFDIQLDSLAKDRENKILYASDMELDFNSFELYLRDSVHKLEAKSMFVSSKLKTLKARELKIRPTGESKANVSKDILTIEIPEIDIVNFDLFHMFLNGDLSADLLNLNSPFVKIENNTRHRKDSSNKKSADDIYSLFANYLRTAKFERVSLNNGGVDFIQRFFDKNEEIKADNISIDLINFEFDSARFVSKDQILFSDHIEFELKDYDFILPNEVNEITVGLFKFSSKDRLVRLENIEMRPISGVNIKSRLAKHKKSGYFEFKIPLIEFNDFHILKAFNQKRIDIADLYIHKPILKSITFPDLEATGSLPPELSEIEDIILSQIPLFNINSIHIENGKLETFSHGTQIRKTVISNDFNIRINNLNMSSDSVDRKVRRLFFSEGVLITFLNQKIFMKDNTHVLSSDSITLKYPGKNIKIYGFNLDYDKSKITSYKGANYYNISSPLVSLDGIKLQKAYDNQMLKIKSGSMDSVFFNVFQNPNFLTDTIQSNQDFAMPEFLTEMNLEKFNLKNGLINYYNSKGERLVNGVFDLNSSKFSISDLTIGDSPKELPLEKLNLTFSRLEYLISDAYTLNAKNLNFNLENKSISSSKLEVSLDSNDIIDSISTERANRFALNIDSFNISGINFENLYLDNRLEIEGFDILRPEITEYLNKKDSSKLALEKINIYPSLRKYLSYIEMNTIKIYDGNFNSIDFTTGDSLTNFSLDEIYVDVEDFLLNETSHLDEERFLYSKNINFRLKNFSRVSKDGMLKFNFDEIGFETGKNNISAKNFHLEPMFDDFEYSRKLGFQTDRTDVKISSVILSNVDLMRFYNYNELDAGGLLFDSLKLDDYRDKRVENRIGFKPPLPQELIRNAPFSIFIDSMHIKNSYARYREFAPNGEAPGEIYFDEINSKIYQISNEKDYYLGTPSTFMFSYAKLMGEGDIIMTANFNLLDTNNTFSIRGSLGQMDMTKVNPMVEKVAFVTIKSGISNSLNFNFDADENYARGKLEFKYSKFKIFVINKKTGEPEGLDEGIVSWFANTFLINTKNPHLGFFKEGEVFFRRDKSKSIVNYVWKSIFSGVKTSIGAQTQKKLHKIAEKEERALNK